MTTPTITELYNQLGTMMGSWQRFLDQQMAWQAGPNANDDVSPPNGDSALRGYRVMQDSTGNAKNVMTPAQLEKIAKDAVKLITDLNPTELASNFSSLRNDANAIATTLNSTRSELTALKDQTVSAKNAAKQSESSAATSAQSAAVSSSNASNSATAAASSASSALASKDSAAGSASTATQKANDAGASAAKAQSWASAALDVQVETGKYSALHHASKAAGSASTASTKAAEAVTSANSAASSASIASTRANEASASAITAATNASDASSSAASAATSASTATTKATEAASSATKSQNWATGAVDFQVESGKYSALHHATKAAASAASAQSSASTATTKASEAANSASTAATAATTSTTKASEASTAASTAATKASDAAASATLAGTKATAASNSATAAAGSATAAANSATAAANSATESASSASMAEQYMLEAKNAMYVSTGALVEAGDVSMASGSYPSPLLDAKGNKLATFWKVTAAGVSSDGVDYQVGDTLVYSVATNSYYKIDNTESVTSVNGKKGAVTLTHADVGALAATATAVAATKLATARSVSLTGGATGTGSFDGTANLSIAVTVGDDTHKHTFANLKSLPTTLAGYGITDAASLSHGHSDLLSKAGGAMSGAMTINIASNPTIAGTNFANGWLQVGNSTAGIAIDPNEIFNVGTDLIIGTLTAGTGIQFKPGGGTGSAAGEVKTDGLYSMGSKVLTESAGVAVSASKWSSARTVTFQGDASGSTSIDGTKDVTVTLTVDGNAHDHAIARITGLQSALDSKINVGSAPTKGSTGATGNGVTYTRLASLPANIGSGSCSLHLLVTGGSNFGGNHVPLFSVAFSTRGYSGSGAHTAGMIRAVSLNNSPSSVTFYAVTNATTSRVELWMRRESYSHTVDVTVVNSNGGQLHVDGTTATAPTGDVTEFAPVTLYHSNNKPTLAELGAMSAAGGEMLGSLTLGTNDLIFKGADTGDIVFANADGSQKGRVWHSGSGLMFASTASTSPTAAGSMQLTSAGLTIGGNLVYHAGNKPTTSDIGAVAKSGDTMTGPLAINVDSASTRFLSAVNETDGWTWIQMGKSATANQGHFAWNTQSYEGHPANAFHFRPTGGPTVMSAAKGAVTIYKDAVLDFQGNSTWGGKLRVGGNGRTASNDGVTASVVTTNGNLHLDAASGDRAVYLSFYAGSAGVKFGNGAGVVVGSVDNAGNMSMNGTITAPTFAGSLSGTATNADKLDGINSTGFARAYSSSYSFGGNNSNITTADFIAILSSLGAFNQPYWIAKGSWSYASNQKITDTGCGYIDLAGSVVEVFGDSSTYIIRVTTPTTSSGGGITHAQFTYVNHGSGYSPGWRRDFNTSRPPSAAEVGAMADGGSYGTVTFNNWVRTTGNTGWYNATHGGGMVMSDSTWVRTSHQKKFYVDNADGDAIYTAGGVKALKYMYVSGDWWRDNMAHSWNNNRYTGAPFSVDFYNVAAGSFLPMVSSYSTQAGAGYSARIKFGVLREAAGWDRIKAAIYVGSAENDGHPLGIFSFDMYGRAGATTFDAGGTGSSQGLAFNGKTAIGGSNDGWLRLNPHNNFDTGIYCGNLIFRTDGEFQVGGNGSSFKVTAAGAVSAAGQVTAPQFNGYLNGTAAVATYLNSGASSTGVTSIASRVNSGFYECSAPTTANGWPVTGSWYHMMASTHSNGSNYFSMQFAADFYNSNNLFFRCTNGNGATGWNRVWHSGNFNPDAKMGDGGTYGTLYLNNWFRSNGATGWYNQTYGGGIYMEDATWVRTYGTKKFYVDNTAADAIHTAGGVKALGGVYDGSARVYSANNKVPTSSIECTGLSTEGNPYGFLTTGGSGAPTFTYASNIPTIFANYQSLDGSSKPNVGCIAIVNRITPSYTAAAAVAFGGSIAGSALNIPNLGTLTGTWKLLGALPAIPGGTASQTTSASVLAIRIA